MSERTTLKDKNIKNLTLGNMKIRFDPEDTWVGRGGTCLVYHADEIRKTADGKDMLHRIILKEFYPVLRKEELVRITRESDGRLVIPKYAEGSQEDSEYKRKLRRFQKSHEIYNKFHSDARTNNYVVQSGELVEANGTWYLTADYDEAVSLDKYLQEKHSLYEVLYILKKCADSMEAFHSFEENGERCPYLHLDLKPENLLIFKDGYIKVMDGDSFVSKADISSGNMELSASTGYTAPEIYGITDPDRSLYSRMVLQNSGERADIFSLGAILYRYLYGDILQYMNSFKTEKGTYVQFDTHKAESLLKEFSYEQALEARILEKYEDCPRKGIRLIRQILRKTLAYRSGNRYACMKELSAALDEVLPYVKPDELRLHDNFRRNECKVFGREKKLAQIEKAFLEQREKGSRIVCISGTGGIGKSTLAREYAAGHEEEYDTIVEIHAESARQAVLSMEIINLRDMEELKGYETTDPLYFTIKKRKLVQLLEGHKTLMIVHDYNVDEDESFDTWNELGCDIILTSWYDWSDTIPSVILTFRDLSAEEEPQAAAGIFRQFYLLNAEKKKDRMRKQRLENILEEESEQAAMAQLVRRLDYHPLGIRVTAMQMAYVQGDPVKPSGMLQELEAEGIRKDSLIKFRNGKDHGRSGTVGDAYHHLELIFGAAVRNGRLNDMEKEVLRYMTLVPSHPGTGLRRFTDWTNLGEDAGKCLARLVNKGWIEYDSYGRDLLGDEENANQGTYRMPMVTAEVLYRQKGMESTMGNSENFVERCLGRKIDRAGSYEEREQIGEQCAGLVQHLKEEETAEYALLLNNSGYNLENSAKNIMQRNRALSYMEKALEIRRKVLGEWDEDTALSYNNVGYIYWKNGEKEKGFEYQKKALGIWRKVLGKWHVATSTGYSCVGMSYCEIGERKKGLKYLKKALKICRKALGEWDKDTANCYNNVGGYYRKIGKRKKGLRYEEKALEINRKVLGEWHENTALGYNSVGRSYENDGEWKKGLEYQEKALEIRRKVLGEWHEKTAESYNNVGISYWDNGKWKKGLEYQEKALEIRRRVLGEWHADTAISYDNVGISYWDNGKWKKSLEYQEKALEIRRKVLGEWHADTADSYYSVGYSYEKNGEGKKGLEYMEKALEIRRKVLGEWHADTANCYNNVGIGYWENGEWDKSLEYQEKALEIYRKVLGEWHEDTASSYNNVGMSYCDNGEGKKGLKYMEKALKIRRKVLGEDHSLTKKSRRRLESYQKHIAD